MMVDIVWKVSDGKFRPGIGVPTKGKKYCVAKFKADSYILQNLAEYPLVETSTKRPKKLKLIEES